MPCHRACRYQEGGSSVLVDLCNSRTPMRYGKRGLLTTGAKAWISYRLWPRSVKSHLVSAGNIPPPKSYGGWNGESGFSYEVFSPDWISCPPLACKDPAVCPLLIFFQGLVFQSPLNDIRLCPEAQGSAPRRKSICRPLPGSTPPRPGSQTSSPGLLQARSGGS